MILSAQDLLVQKITFSAVTGWKITIKNNGNWFQKGICVKVCHLCILWIDTQMTMGNVGVAEYVEIMFKKTKKQQLRKGHKKTMLAKCFVNTDISMYKGTQ